MNREVAIDDRQKKFRAVGIVLFCTSLGLLVARVLLRYIMKLYAGKLDDATEEIVTDVIFTICSQVIVLFVIPFTVYKLYLKKSAKEIFFLSNFRPTDKRVYFLSVLLGISACIVSMGVSVIWQMILLLLGCDATSSSTMPETFQWWHLLLSLILTAVLPAICEEFVNRGMLVGVLRNSFSEKMTVLLGGIAFGLFHQYISQTVYTALMGMLLTYLVLKTRSIIPAAIVHFTNNAISVIMEFMQTYASPENPLMVIGDFIMSDMRLMAFVWLAGIVALLGLLHAIKKCYSSYYCDNYAGFLKTGDENCYNKIACDWTCGNVRYKPTKSDAVFYIGSLIITAAYTLFSFFRGYF